MIAYHGTIFENIAPIFKLGFKPGTYFAYSRQNAVEFGGPFVFTVEFSDDPSLWHGISDGWQFHLRGWHGSKYIKGFSVERRRSEHGQTA